MIGGCSLLLDGTNDYVDLGTVAARNFTSSPFSLLAWIYPRSLAATMRILQHGVSATSGYSFRSDSTGALILGTSSPAEAVTKSAASALVANRWQHVAAVRSGSAVDLFIGGELATSVVGVHSDPVSSAAKSVVGATVAGAADFFNGAVDEAAFFNVALTQHEIRAYMHRSIPASAPGLVSLHHFDDGIANFAATSAAAAVSGVAGTLTGGATWVFDRWAPWVEPRVSATGALTVTSDAAATVPGTLRNFIPRLATRVAIVPLFDFELTTLGAGSILGLVRVNGTPLAPQAIVAAGAGMDLFRLPLSQILSADWSAETLYSVDLAARLSNAADAIRGTIGADHSGYAIVAQPIDGTF